MFGYIKIYEPSLNKESKMTYRAIYCGLCKSLAENFGQVARLTLNNDCTFLLILLLSIQKTPIMYSNQTCIMHFLKKSPMMLCENSTILLVSAINILLFYYKIKDDVEDKDKILSNQILKAITPAYKKAKNLLPTLNDTLNKNLENINLEEKNKSNLATLLNLNGKMLEDIAKALQNTEYNNLSKLLFYIGELIYFFDALDDIEKDIKNNNFNALMNEFYLKNCCDVSINKKENRTTNLSKRYKTFYKKEITNIYDNIYTNLINHYNLLKSNNENLIIKNIILESIPNEFNELISK